MVTTSCRKCDPTFNGWIHFFRFCDELRTHVWYLGHLSFVVLLLLLSPGIHFHPWQRKYGVSPSTLNSFWEARSWELDTKYKGHLIGPLGPWVFRKDHTPCEFHLLPGTLQWTGHSCTHCAQRPSGWSLLIGPGQRCLQRIPQQPGSPT